MFKKGDKVRIREGWDSHVTDPLQREGIVIDANLCQNNIDCSECTKTMHILFTNGEDGGERICRGFELIKRRDKQQKLTSTGLRRATTKELLNVIGR